MTPKNDTTYVSWLLLLSFIGTFSMALALPLMVALALSVVGLWVAILSNRSIDIIGVLIVWNFIVWLVSGLFSGGIQVAELISPAFLTGEGRIFVAYIPALALCFFIPSMTSVRLLLLTSIALAFVVLGLFLVWLVSGGKLFSVGAANHFAGLLTSHTGAGTFLTTLAAFLLVYYFFSGYGTAGILGAFLLCPALASGSRSSLLALCVVILWVMIKQRRIKTLVPLASMIFAIVISIPLFAPKMYERTALVFQSTTLIDSIYKTVENTDWQPGLDREIEGREVNILSRFLFWTYAYGRFLDSPYVGIGFGRYNDYELMYEGSKGVYYIATDSEQRRVSAANAHNSYIHLLAENGLLGLISCLSLWFCIYHRLITQIRNCTSALVPVFRSAQALIVFLFINAMFGHGLAAPSVVIPVSVIAVILCRLPVSAHRFVTSLS